MKEYRVAIIMALIGIILILLGLYLQGEDDKRERCYNMPINQYVEDKDCEKYTWEEYMEEHYG